ncbi:hypothetical protein PRK78_002410 [Emydomyces testavorans]|uniref:Uncharacterized protein n=1 Tax=Emydomyces testavorans TaxID=2070801 RepID=A0AAF0IHR8_9EURO|nr:hypothetical protein PRK78_002410 [Emydomyces testavorans]
MTWITHPQGCVTGLANGPDKRRQNALDIVCTQPRNDGDPANIIVVVVILLGIGAEAIQQLNQRLACHAGPDLDADWIPKTTDVFQMATVELPCPITNPDKCGRSVVVAVRRCALKRQMEGFVGRENRSRAEFFHRSHLGVGSGRRRPYLAAVRQCFPYGGPRLCILASNSANSDDRPIQPVRQNVRLLFQKPDFLVDDMRSDIIEALCAVTSLQNEHLSKRRGGEMASGDLNLRWTDQRR